MKSDVVIDSQDRITSEAIEYSAAKLVPEGSVLVVVRSGILARTVPVAIAGRDLTINQDLKAIIPNEKLDTRFLAYFLRASEPNLLRSVTRGATVHRLTTDILKTLPIPLPPLEEQRRIVAALDEAFEGLDRARAHAERNWQGARELFQSILKSAFSERQESWRAVELNEHVRFVDYRGKTPPKCDHGIRLITAKNVKMGFIQREPAEFMVESAYEGWMTRGIPKLGDILFTTEAPLANVAQLDTDERVVIGQRLITMQPDQNVLLPTFLKFALMSPQMRTEILDRGTGATVVGIKARLLKTVPLYYPKNTEDQRLISERCQRVYEFMEELQLRFLNKLQDVDNLRQSLLHRAFAGKLT